MRVYKLPKKDILSETMNVVIVLFVVLLPSDEPNSPDTTRTEYQ